MNNILIIIGIIFVIKVILLVVGWQWIAAFCLLIREIYE